MKEACLAANEIIASKSYAAESEIATKIFRDVKADTVSLILDKIKLSTAKQLIDGCFILYSTKL